MAYVIISSDFLKDINVRINVMKIEKGDHVTWCHNFNTVNPQCTCIVFKSYWAQPITVHIVPNLVFFGHLLVLSDS